MKTDHVYIHFPFCRKKCPYCDFFSLENAGGAEYKKYTGYIHKEIDLYRDYFSGKIRTVYFGGGTPSLMDPDDLGKILRRFPTGGDAEVTLEVNPATADHGRLKAFLQAGVTRLSVGSQSFIDRELLTLGRIHSSDDIYEVFGAARKAGFDNINLDLIVGIPGSTPAAVVHNSAEICALAPEHVSAYILTYYEATAYRNMLDSGTIRKLDDDTEIGLFNLSAEILKKYGYSRYEISNFSKPGFESRHNMNTWDFGSYIGLGASAHSFLCDFRWENPSPLKEYYDLTDSEICGVDPENSVDMKTLKNEFMILGLRKTGGLSMKDYRAKFGTEITDDFRKEIDYCLSRKTLSVADGNIKLPEDKFDIFNTIVSGIIL
jgi:oxygen-independent coproporphyrinogen-3 oxidase